MWKILLILIIPFSKHQILNSNKYIELKTEINNFISKYKNQNCIMEVFTSLETQCENISDELMMELSYKLSICSLSKFGKYYPICDYSKGYKFCIQELKGDLWTTYTSFYHHIDNICFYYKTLKWEKSTDLILSNLILSSQIAEDIINLNKNFSEEIKRNFTQSVNQLNNLNDFMKSYIESEKLIKENLKEIEMKIYKNKEHYAQIQNFISNYFWFLTSFFSTQNGGILNFIKFFSILFIVELFISVFLLISKIKLIVLYLFFLIYEIYIVQIFSNLIYFSLIISISRLIYYVIIILIIIIEKYSVKQKNKIYLTYSQIKNFVQITPSWVKDIKKYEKLNSIYNNSNNKSINKYIN